MELTAHDIASATFRVVRKGYDPDEVRAFQEAAAKALEDAQNLAALMEQRARASAKAAAAAVAPVAPPAPPAEAPSVSVGGVTMRADDAETISRTLLLAQRTAERAVEEATQEAAAIRLAGQTQAREALDQAAIQAAQLLDSARLDARRAGEAERTKVMGEVHALLAPLDFLRQDVDALAGYAARQRQQLLDAAEALRQVAAGQIGEVAEQRRPALSAAADMERLDAAAVPTLADVVEPDVRPEAASRAATRDDSSPVPTVRVAASAAAPMPMVSVPTSESTQARLDLGDDPTAEVPVVRQPATEEPFFDDDSLPTVRPRLPRREGTEPPTRR